jgi:hypothetical protein
MTQKRILSCTCCVLLMILFSLPAFSQEDRGKAELSAGTGSITIDYGRPSLKGRDMLAKLSVGDYWRMGSGGTTVLNTPVDLVFGNAKVAKGRYSLWLKRADSGKFELVINSLIEMMGMNHDESKDVAVTPMKGATLTSPVETLSMELKSAPDGGVFIMRWGTTELTTDFQLGK